MPINILMPALSPTMTEGTLSAWHKKEGDPVKSGDVIAEIETDKATMEVEAVDEGTVGRIIVPAGTEHVAVNAVIAVLLVEGEDAGAIRDQPTVPDSGGSGSPAAGGNGTKPPVADAPREPEKAVPTPAVPQRRESGERIVASPLARRMARQAGLDLAAITGSGPHGRIVRSDIEAAAQAGTKPAAAEPEAPATALAQTQASIAAPKARPPARAAGLDTKALADAYGIPYVEVKNSGTRKTVARRLSESKQTVPHFYVTVECRIDALLDLRRQLNGLGDVKLSVNDLLIKAAALALRKVPAANASWTDDAILRYGRVDISVAVAIEDGLITPIVKDADRKGLGAISAEMKDLATRARAGKLKPEEYQGGTFSISNLGMFGVTEFQAIINPPQACILAVGTGTQRPVVTDGALAVATVMNCTLAVDHRVVDGAVGAAYLAAFRALVESPLGMLL
jgi:pyruvate dehydrogenase E2 component (dihydrolipoamide acetyltransferase)